VIRIDKEMPQLLSSGTPQTSGSKEIVMADDMGTLSPVLPFGVRKESRSFSESQADADPVPAIVEDFHLALSSAVWPTATEKAAEEFVMSHYSMRNESRDAIMELKTQI